HHLGQRTASRAEAVPLMPIDHRLRLRDDRGVLERDHLRSDTSVAEIAETCKPSDPSVVGFGNIKREYRSVAIETQKDPQSIGARERVRDFRPHQPELDRRVRLLRTKKK